MDNQAPLSVPLFESFHDIPVGWQYGSIGRDVVDWTLHLIQHEYRRPPMVMQWFFVVRLQRYFKHA